MAFDWGSLLGGGLDLLGGYLNSNANTNAAQNLQQQSQYRPYSVYGPYGAAQYNGQNINLGVSPGTQGLMDSLQGGGNSVTGKYLSSLQGQPGNLGQLGNEFNLANQADSGQQAMGLGNSFLSQLGSTDPNQLASSYASNLRQLSAPGEQNAANSLASRLFSQGRLGTTGGQGMFGELMNQQNQAEIARQVAGQQYGQQQQAGLAQIGSNLQNQGYSRVADRYARAQSLFGANSQNQSNLLGGFQGLLGASNNLQGGLLNMAQLGAQAGGAQAGANYQAGVPVMNAQQSQNNSLYGGIGQILGGINWGGLFGGSGQQQSPSVRGPI